MTLSPAQLDAYRRTGHLTVPGVFSASQMDAAVADATAWGNELLGRLDDRQRAWYLEAGAATANVLRKLDDPVFHRPVFREVASHPPLVAIVEQLIGPGLRICFSQIFFKPPGGGPKPVHQDNFYFGPNNADGLVTAWIALDDATIENGCLCFGEGTNRGPVVDHVAPTDEPFNLQIPAEIAARQPMTPAPVPRGGVSFHHGNTFHQSSANRSNKWRRAAAVHYVNAQTRFTRPALPYDEGVAVRIT